MLSYFVRLSTRAQRRLTPKLLLAASTLALTLAATAIAGDIDRRLDEKERSLDRTRAREGVLTTEIESARLRMAKLRTRVADLRNERAAVLEELESAERDLGQAEIELAANQQRLRRSTKAMRAQLVEIYKLGEIPTVALVLQSDGLEQITTRSYYLGAFEDNTRSVVDRVESLREQARATFEIVRSRRDEVAQRKMDLESLRGEIGERQSALSRSISRERARLARVSQIGDRLEGGVARLQEEIAARLVAAQDTSAEQTGPSPIGPTPGESSSGLIWPVDGAFTSPFGPRWGRLHAGIDIAAPGGTPIVAAGDGRIVFARSVSESGGYGNYTCVEHGGGLSTCYAHQSAFAVTAGTVRQGQVIGYVGNTGNSFGDHLHFEVRLDGQPVDPMGYL